MREFEGAVQNLCIHMCENGLDTRTPPPCRYRSSRAHGPGASSVSKPDYYAS